MATYLQGVTDYIPQIQPFTPDYNFYSGALQFKQSKHDAARKQLSSLYGSLLNAPLTREDNIESRDQFFKAIDQDIQRMATMDLSLAQNTEAAMGVFNQLTENQNIVRDMVWTKKWMKEMEKGQYLKNCVDPEKCGGSWWEGGDRLMNYQRDMFRRASSQEAMNMNTASYVAHQDITKRALDLVKDAGIDIEVDQVSGQWITTTKNGVNAIAPIENILMGSIGNDPKVKEYFNAQAQLQRLDFMYNNEQTYGSLDEAEQAYISQMMGPIENMFAGVQQDLEGTVDRTGVKIEKLDNAINNSVPEKRSRLEKIRDDFNQLQSGYTSSLEEVKNVNGEVTVAGRNGSYTGSQVDRIMGSYAMRNEIGSQAKALAFKDYKLKIKENPYAIEATRHKNRMLLEEYKQRNKMEFEIFKEERAQIAEQNAAMGGAEANSPITVTDVDGNTAVVKGDEWSYDVLNRGFNKFAEDRDGLRTNISQNEIDIIDQVARRTQIAADQGDVQAREDWVNMVENYLDAASNSISEESIGSELGQSASDDEEVSISSVVGEVSKMVKNNAAIASLRNKLFNANSVEEKYHMIRNEKFNSEMLNGGQIDLLYESTISPMLKSTEGGNEVLRDYLAPIWKSPEYHQKHNSILAKNEALSQMDNWYGEESSKVAQRARASSAYGDKWADAFESYIDDKGHVVNKDVFVANMQEKGYSAWAAEKLYRGDRKASWNDPDEWGDATGNVLGMVGDAVGTTLAGIFTLGNYGFDYDDAGDVANWDAPGQNEAENKSGYADAGLHDMWKRAFSEFGEPSGDKAWLGITGAGNETALGQKYQVVDPAQYRSTGTMGAIGFLQDAINNENAVFDLGGFSTNMPVNNNTAKEIANVLYKDMLTMKSDKNRPKLTVTYSDIAASDDGKVGLNIQFNQDYIKKYQGSEKNKGLMRGLDLSGEGITIYTDKSSAKNLFTQGARQTPVEKLMDWTGKVEMNNYGFYTKDFNITADPTTGDYKASGLVVTGLDENGYAMYDYYESMHSNVTDLNDLIAQYDNMLSSVAVQNKAIEDKWLLQNSVK